MSLRAFFFHRNLEEDENILYIVHKHWFLLVFHTLKTFFFGFLIPFALYYIFPVLFWIMIIWMSIAFIRYIYHLFDWYLDAWLLTDKALIDVIWEGFFSRSAQRIEYKSVEQVSYSIKGFWQTIFRFGTVEIQQPGGATSISNIEKPYKVAATIAEFQEKMKANSKFEDEEALKDILSGMIKKHIERHGLQINIEDKDKS